MVTINNNNVQEYIDKQLIDPYKIKIDLNTSKTTSDNVNRWITLADAIKGGYKFNFDYDINDKPTEAPTLPEVVVTPLPRMYSVGAGEMKPFNSAAEAAKYVKEHPKKDASEVDTNYLLLGSLGLSRPLGRILWNGVRETLPYFSANGWLQSTQAVGNTPAWLTPRVATAIDAGLAGSATGASMYDWYQNGPSVENVLGTTLGVGGLAFEAAPIIMEGYNAVKKAYNTYQLSRAISKAPFTPEYEVWLEFPQLQEIGSIQDYQNYLTTIFPKSKYSQIAYHGGPKGITRFRTPNKEHLNKNINTGTKDYGIYFAKDKALGEYYARSQKKGNQQLYRVKLNLENPMRYDNPSFTQKFIGGQDLRFSPDAISKYWYNRLGLNKYNGIIQDKSGSPFSRRQITMFNPDDIHILGSPNDVTKFNNWKLNPTVNNYTESSIIPNTPALYHITAKNIAKQIGGLLPIELLAGTIGAGTYYLLSDRDSNKNKENNEKD